MKTIPFLKESPNGHDTQQTIPGKPLQQEVEKELQNDKWVTIEKPSGEKEILTKTDIPPERQQKIEEEEEETKEEKKEETKEEKEEDKKEETPKTDWKQTFNGKTETKKSSVPSMTPKEKDWAKKFEPKMIKSAVSTNKAKGG